MGIRGGEKKGTQQLKYRGSVGFVLEFLQGMALERGVWRVLPLGLFLGFCDKVLTGLWPSADAASPTLHPPAQREPPSLPVLTFHLVSTQKLV